MTLSIANPTSFMLPKYVRNFYRICLTCISMWRCVFKTKSLNIVFFDEKILGSFYPKTYVVYDFLNIYKYRVIIYIYIYKYDQKLCDKPNYLLEGSLVAKFLNCIGLCLSCSLVRITLSMMFSWQDFYEK